MTIVNIKGTVKRGTSITYTREFMFGKTAVETAKVVAIMGRTLLLDNGDEVMKG